MLSSLQADYVRTARAKGLPERVVVLRHALRNALIPVVTLGTLQLGELLSGAVLTEQIFTIPGFGKLIVDAVFNRDYAVVQGVVLFTGTAFILMNLLTDMLYSCLTRGFAPEGGCHHGHIQRFHDSTGPHRLVAIESLAPVAAQSDRYGRWPDRAAVHRHRHRGAIAGPL